MPEAQDAVFRPYRIGVRDALQCRGPSLDDEIVDRQLERGIAVAVLGRRRVRLFAQRQQAADIDIGGEIEMRNGLLGLHQPGRDGAPHGVERHLLERAVAVERHDLLGGGTGDAC